MVSVAKNENVGVLLSLQLTFVAFLHILHVATACQQSQSHEEIALNKCCIWM